MARSKLPADTGIRLGQWQRWGGCDAGTAARCAGEITTGQRFPRVAAHRAETPHRPRVPHVEGAGVPWAEAPATLRPTQVAGVPTALAMGSGGSAGSTGGRVPRAPRPRGARRAARAPGSSRSGARRGGTPRQRHDSKSLGACRVASVGGPWAARRRPGWERRARCARPTVSRSVPTLARAGRSTEAWAAAVRGAVGSREASGSAGRRSRPPVWNGGRAPGGGWSPPGGGARGVCRGAGLAIGARSGSSSAAPTV